jgi:hypothetical protein
VRITVFLIGVFLIGLSLIAAEKLPAPRLLEMARQHANTAEFHDALIATLGDADLKKGAAMLGEGPDFLWAVESESKPSLVIDEGAPLDMTRAHGNLWSYTGKLKTGTSHEYHYLIDGKRFGGKTDVPAYLPECYEQPGVPQGKLSDKIVHASKIYPGMQTNYWIYVQLNMTRKPRPR